MAINYWNKLEEGNVYHIYNHAVGDLNLFNDEYDFDYFLSKYQKYFQPYLETYTYCLMPNHFHILFKVKLYFSNTNTFIDKKELLQWIGGVDVFHHHHSEFKNIKRDELNYDME